MRGRSALVVLGLGILSPGAAFATDVSNYSFNPYAYRTISPQAASPQTAPPAASVAPAAAAAPAPRPSSAPARPASPGVPRSAALPLPDNGACVGLCRLFELMWRQERPAPYGAVPTS